ncbi:MAG: LacI family DNA-binding transcriptional regulator [Chloroflexota bacterium]
MTTIREVAEKAGVSIGTVSRALNNKNGVGDQTRQRIIEVSRELGYSPNRRVPDAAPETLHVGVLIAPLPYPPLSDPFYSMVVQGVVSGLKAAQVGMTLESLSVSDGKLIDYSQIFHDDRLQGYVVVGGEIVNYIDQLSAVIDDPIVLVDADHPRPMVDSVMADNAKGGYQAAIHLIEQGHTHIIQLGGMNHSSLVERRVGYERAMHEHGLQPKIVGSSVTLTLTPQDAAATVDQILAEAPETTGIICLNDIQAVAIMHELKRRGHNIPQDYSIIGFDDIEMIKYISPALTTVRIDRLGMGEMAIYTLLGRINNPERFHCRVTFNTELVVRESSGPPRQP